MYVWSDTEFPFTFSSGVKNIDTHDFLIGFNVTIKDEQAPAEPEAPEAPVPLEINLDGDNGFILEDDEDDIFTSFSTTDLVNIEVQLSDLEEAESSTETNPKYKIGTAVFTFNRQLTETELSDMFGAIYMNGTASMGSPSLISEDSEPTTIRIRGKI